VGERLGQRVLKSASGECICQDPDYVDVYRAKYGEHADLGSTSP